MRTMKQSKKDKKTVGSCECCGNYVYDEENEYYVCEVDLDEDDGTFPEGRCKGMSLLSVR